MNNQDLLSFLNTELKAHVNKINIINTLIDNVTNKKYTNSNVISQSKYMIFEGEPLADHLYKTINNINDELNNVTLKNKIEPKQEPKQEPKEEPKDNKVIIIQNLPKLPEKQRICASCRHKLNESLFKNQDTVENRVNKERFGSCFKCRISARERRLKAMNSV